jgi:DnaJ-class molecular chaperone
MRFALLLFLYGLARGSPADYAALNLDMGAEMDDVKSAYRREALKWHPDTNSDPDAISNFRRVSDAYTNIKSAHASPNHQRVENADPFQTWSDFMGSGFSFSFSSGGAKVSGTSQSSSTVIQNGKKITKVTKTDLTTRRSEITVTEEDLGTGRKTVKRLIEFGGKEIEL